MHLNTIQSFYYLFIPQPLPFYGLGTPFEMVLQDQGCIISGTAVQNILKLAVKILLNLPSKIRPKMNLFLEVFQDNIN